MNVIGLIGLTCVDIEENITFTGTAEIDKEKTLNQHECQMLCQETTECVSWNWHKNNKDCWIDSAVDLSKKYSDSNYWAGLMCSRLPECECTGNINS